MRWSLSGILVVTLLIEQSEGMVSKVVLPELLSTCIDAASRGCGEIRRVQKKRASSGGSLDVTLKDETDARSALTEADVAAQKAIVDALRAEWPGLCIVGEEDESGGGQDPGRIAGVDHARGTSWSG